jgi:hypothetical protein
LLVATVTGIFFLAYAISSVSMDREASITHIT